MVVISTTVAAARFSFSSAQKMTTASKVRYLTHKTLRTKLQQTKKYNSYARVMGLDIGRKYTGVALSCKEIILAKGHKTLMMPERV